MVHDGCILHSRGWLGASSIPLSHFIKFIYASKTSSAPIFHSKLINYTRTRVLGRILKGFSRKETNLWMCVNVVFSRYWGLFINNLTLISPMIYYHFRIFFSYFLLCNSSISTMAWLSLLFVLQIDCVWRKNHFEDKICVF